MSGWLKIRNSSNEWRGLNFTVFTTSVFSKEVLLLVEDAAGPTIFLNPLVGGSCYWEAFIKERLLNPCSHT